jgi:NAD(P)-dependent dehydrogenase (short-subunit alcohol dehydrogenase family)
MSRSIQELMSLKGRTALITGASGKLGSIFSETLAEAGCSLVLVDRDSLQLETMKQDFSRYQVEILCCEYDLELSDERIALKNEVISRFPGIDILINNAAFVGNSDLSGWSTTFENQSVETWRRALEVNLVAVFELCQLFNRHMNPGTSSIINMGSIYGFSGPVWELYEDTDMSNPAAYAASKGGLIQLTRWLATTLSPNIRVNSISPGGIFNNQAENFIKKYAKRTPLGRMGEPEDLKGALLYLASDLSRYVTGQNLIVDGGWSTW